MNTIEIQKIIIFAAVCSKTLHLISTALYTITYLINMETGEKVASMQKKVKQINK